ncbi:uncharacterized protein TNIN_435691 [Trichonephila inaurata madagascariensis]|uniref:Uncharacterized protein n=1 Tax=Trichonephila inaurata madagascariensis TaxID=2747483 RepID=A0A8X6Y087_9ARAC|nr:uncharacterized protein TNIN_435691 [Trichonephila inaurata madagascariensis]
MLSRLNAPSEVSILPTGLGNHYTSSSRHLIPPGRRRFPYNHSVSSNSDCYGGDPNAPEANMSFREHQEYFGPDVLVIIGLVLACLGAILTLISFYCQFKHPAIQATMAGIGPSLVGIGMLFCVLRLFFCTFCISKTCCECIADGLRFMIIRCPCCKYFRKPKKKIHPLQVKDIHINKPTANGQMIAKTLNSVSQDSRKQGSSNGLTTRNINNNNIIHLLPPDTSQPGIEMSTLSTRMEPINESEEARTQSSATQSQEENDSITEVRVDSSSSIEDNPKEGEEDDLKDEIDLLEEMKSEASGSPKSLHKNINELVLKTQPRY